MAALVRTEMGLQVRNGGVPDDREWDGQGGRATSREAYESLSDLGARQLRVWSIINECGPCTDREILEILGGDDMNQVRPRVTELIRMGHAREYDKMECPVTYRRVRRVAAITEADRWEQANQLELGIRSW